MQEPRIYTTIQRDRSSAQGSAQMANPLALQKCAPGSSLSEEDSG